MGMNMDVKEIVNESMSGGRIIAVPTKRSMEEEEVVCGRTYWFGSVFVECEVSVGYLDQFHRR